MNPIVAILVAAVANLASAFVAAAAPRSEARVATLTGAVVTFGAAALAGIQLVVHHEATTWAWRGIALRADALTGTMLVPFALAGAAIALGVPWRRASSRVLAATSITLAAGTFGLVADNLVLLVAAEVVSALAVAWALGAPGRAGRVYLGLSIIAMVAAGALSLVGDARAPLSTGPVREPIAWLMLAGALVRLGVVPAHTGLTATLDGAPLGRVALLAAPLSGVLPLVRVVHPALSGLAVVDLVGTAVLAGALVAAFAAVAASDLGRSIGWTLAAMHGLLVTGAINSSSTGVIGGELMWAGILLSELGLVLAGVMVTRRVGALDLRRLHGLYALAPWLALGFLLNALAVAGLPGTLVFVANDVLLSSESGLGLVGPVLASVLLALVGFNSLRMTFHVFLGPSELAVVNMDANGVERLVLLGLLLALLAGGVAPGLLPVVAAGH